MIIAIAVIYGLGWLACFRFSVRMFLLDPEEEDPWVYGIIFALFASWFWPLGAAVWLFTHLGGPRLARWVFLGADRKRLGLDERIAELEREVLK